MITNSLTTSYSYSAPLGIINHYNQHLTFKFYKVSRVSFIMTFPHKDRRDSLLERVLAYSLTEKQIMKIGPRRRIIFNFFFPVKLVVCTKLAPFITMTNYDFLFLKNDKVPYHHIIISSYHRSILINHINLLPSNYQR